jgi:hypothetical protein
VTMETSGEGVAATAREVADLLLWVGMRGFVERSELERRGTVAELLPRLVADGLLQLDGEFVLLTPEGDSDLTVRLRQLAEVDLTGLGAFFSRFEEMDKELKFLATDWQNIRPRAEEDPDALMTIVERWIALDGKLKTAVAESPSATRLLAAYVQLLSAARRGFDDGDWDRFTGIGEDSYHSAWFAMHEVLLRALGVERTK